MAEKEDKRVEDFVKNIKKNPWIVSTIVLGIVVIVLLYLTFRGGGVSQSEIGPQAVNFINTQLLQGQGQVTLDSVSEKNGIYEVFVIFNGQKVPAYFTKDGKYFVGTNIISTSKTTATTTPTPPKKIPKSDKPKAELFVMTHCPYGTQAEKGVLPAAKALGDKIDFNIRFVHYFMHGDKEEKETYTQLCIREGQKDKYIPYLECFLEDGNSSRCLAKTGISSVALSGCIADKSKDYYKLDSELSQSYGVQGSPTLVINDVQAEFYPRSPSNALQVICSAFNTAPSECSSELSTANPSPGFGTTTTSTTGTDTGATSCGTA